MPRQAEIEKAAQIVVDRHGAGAEAVARQRSLRLSWDGQPRAAMIWQRIGSAIRQLQQPSRIERYSGSDYVRSLDQVAASGS